MLKLILVLSLVFISMMLLFPRIHPPIAMSEEEQEARRVIDSVEIASAIYKKHYGKFPSSNTILNKLHKTDEIPGEWKGPYLSQKVPSTDPWDNAWVFFPSDNCKHIEKLQSFYSVGPNGVDECKSGDDIFSREEERNSR
ncbi:type II secretion system protein GspG [Pseudoalteromonas rubra]|uniref:type II secretion system protein GspG n=1 Tax=Pseudoalteromonas rubra TaxID=43658 RepID=UPI002DBBFE1B|nr:type II secretion system protein GspG [Pseudoalteromonas rubra]MEC4087727.1 type II secretion system protein GspG [Pseudoalteromonas rubra]